MAGVTTAAPDAAGEVASAMNEASPESADAITAGTAAADPEAAAEIIAATAATDPEAAAELAASIVQNNPNAAAAVAGAIAEASVAEAEDSADIYENAVSERPYVNDPSQLSFYFLRNIKTVLGVLIFLYLTIKGLNLFWESIKLLFNNLL